MSSKAEAADAGAVYPPLPRASEGQFPPSYDQATGPPPQLGFHPVQLQQAPYPNQPVLQNTIIMAPPVGPHSTRITCRSCQADISTRVSYDTSSRTHLFALLCCIIFFPCACVPYCMDSCKDTNHYCPNCNAYIGTYRDRM